MWYKSRLVKIPKLQWVIAVLLCLATAINYLDRQALGIVSVDIRREFGLNEREYSYILTFFFLAYAIMYAGSGLYPGPAGNAARLQRVHLLLVAGADAARLRAGQMVAGGVPVPAGVERTGRVAGGGEGGERVVPGEPAGVCDGDFQRGVIDRVGAGSLTVAWLTLHYGWRSAFVITGVAGFVWLALWLDSLSAAAPEPLAFGARSTRA